MAVFTPPSTNDTPPVSEYPPEILANPLGYRLFRYYAARPRGRNVYKLADGTYTENEPWQGTVNDAALPANRQIVYTWYGGHVGETISAADQTGLTAAGYGANIV